MADLLLDTLTHDITLKNGDVILVTGGPEVGQNLKIKLLFFKGEWEFKPDEGMPYFQEILKKYNDETVVSNIFKDVIENAPNVDELINFNARFNRRDRNLTISFRVRAVDGTIVEIEDFIVDA